MAENEVEENALDARHTEPVQDLGQLVVHGVDEAGTFPVGREPLAGQAQGLLVPVEGDQPGLGEPRQQGLAVSAEAECAVDDHCSRPLLQGGCQQVQAPSEHHRDVSTLAQGALSGPARAVRTAGSPPAHEGEVCRRRERQPTGSGRRPSRTYAPRT
ncbi:hypothetical protein SALBM311S_02248 [Streptomyces alboniger]